MPFNKVHCAGNLTKIVSKLILHKVSVLNEKINFHVLNSFNVQRLTDRSIKTQNSILIGIRKNKNKLLRDKQVADDNNSAQ